MEDDIDIYEDLPSFGTKCDETFESNDDQQNRKILSEGSELQKQIGELTVKLEKLQKLNENLEVNLFSLLKTAKAEIARKDKMIDELRKRLDDAAFKRGLFGKTNNQTVIDKSTFCETTVNKHRKSGNFSSSLSRGNDQPSMADSTGDRAKEQPNKANFIPVTVFGERLLRRVALDEQNAETKDRSSNRHMIIPNENRNATDSCTAESDKENGSVNDTGFPNTREPETFPPTRYNGSEHVKNSPTRPRSTSRDVQSQRNSVHARNCAGKRTHHDEDDHYSAKRAKIDGPVRRDECGNVLVESKSSPSCSSTMRRASLEFSTDFCEKGSHTFRDMPSVMCSRDSKEKNDASRDKRNSVERSSKRHDRSAQNSAFTVDERSTDDRGIEFHKRIVFRASYTETRRTKQRDHQRNDDHRSRTKSTSYGKYVRQVKYSRYSNYDERYEDRYDFRGIDSDKTRHSKQDSCNSRGTIKRSTIDRTSRVSKRSSTFTDHSHPAVKISAEKSKKRSRRHEERNEEFAEERAIKRPQVPVSGTKSCEPTIPRVEPDLPSGVQVSQDTATDLEDGEIVNTPDNSPQKTIDRDQPREERHAEAVVEALEDTKLSSSTIYGIHPREHVASEAIENVENIEKFIRNSASAKEKERDVATVSQVAASISDANEIEAIMPASRDFASWQNLHDTRTERTGDLSSSDTSEEDAMVHRHAVPQPETRETMIDGTVPDSVAVSEMMEIREQNNGPDSTNPEHGNDSLMIGTTNGKACDKRARSDLESERASRSPRERRNSRDVTANVQGKIVVFARRKKAVCLTNSNADMTVLMSNEDDVGCR